MADESEIAITIVPDEVANVESATTVEKKEAPVQKTAAAAADDPAKELKSQFEALQKKSDEDNRRRIAAENEAAQARREAEESRKRESSSHLDTITTAISAAQQEAEAAKQAYKIARASNDIDAEAEATDRLAIARADIRRLDEAKQDLEARAKRPQPKPERETALDPVEAFARGRTQPTADWIRAHPEYVRSERGMKKLAAADAVAQAEDLIPDTPEYFAKVEEYLGIRKAAAEDAPTEAAQVKPQPKRSAAPPVAPGSSVSGTGNGNGSHNGQSVTLTAREAAAATDGTHVYNYDDPKGKFKKGDPIGVQEFARRKLALQRQGAYDRSFTEQ